MVQMLVRPYASYYHFDEYPSYFYSPLHRLIYRTIARVRPRNVVLIGQDTILEKVVTLAIGDSAAIMHEIPSDLSSTVIITNQIEDVEVTNSTYLIFTGIRRTKAIEEVFRKWVEGFSNGIVLDLYDNALITGVEGVKYIYRTTL